MKARDTCYSGNAKRATGISLLFSNSKICFLNSMSNVPGPLLAGFTCLCQAQFSSGSMQVRNPRYILQFSDPARD